MMHTPPNKLFLLALLLAPASFSAMAAQPCVALFESVVDLEKLVKGISEEEFLEIERITTGPYSLTARFPPSKYLYVGLGRSPTPITAYLEAAGLAKPLNLPLSNMRASPLEVMGMADDVFEHQFYQGMRPALDEAAKQKLFRHFEKFLPKPEAIAGKKILLIDYTQTGQSALSASEYMKAYYRSKGAEIGVTPYGFRADDLPGIMTLGFIRRGGENTYIEKFALKESFLRQKYDRFSEVPRFDPSVDELPERLGRPQYSILVREFRRRLNCRKNPDCSP